MAFFAKALGLTARVLQPSVNEGIVFSQVVDVEAILCAQLRTHFGKIGFAEVYPNFGEVRISPVHPFALVLLADILGKEHQTNLFPSITITDTADTESVVFLDHESQDIVVTPDVVASLKVATQRKEIVTALSNFTKLNAFLATGAFPMGRQRTSKAQHTLDFNIWTDNKTVTNTLYDLVKGFILNEGAALRDSGVDLIGNISGRKSGDINLELGKILYGANITVACQVDTSVMEVTMEALPNTIVVTEHFHPT